MNPFIQMIIQQGIFMALSAFRLAVKNPQSVENYGFILDEIRNDIDILRPRPAAVEALNTAPINTPIPVVAKKA